ncbi:MAG: DASS family sodium-coupled anion symporter [Gammaproteobacteria bacterium]
MPEWIRQRGLIGLVLGPLVFLLLLALPEPAGLSPQGMRVAAVAALMAIWWVSEAIPVPATALLPILLFPVLGVLGGSEITRAYGHHLIYLFLGGFLIAVTMEKWNLHHRIALHTIHLVGVTPNRIVLGFMLATAFLSMWISNTAATMMMVTIAIAVLRETAQDAAETPDASRFGVTLMLGIAYAASIGGVATLIGTPPNAIFAGVVEKTYGISIGFVDWMKFGLPLSLVMLAITWVYLTRIRFRGEQPQLAGGQTFVNDQIRRLGPMSRAEKGVAAVFSLVALLWILRGLYWPAALGMVTDSTIAIAGALLLFVIPVNLARREFLLDWKTAVTIPWDIILLFGGGFALAEGFSESGLTTWLAGLLGVLQGTDIVLIVAAVVLLVIFLTEVTSNTATASLLLPVMAALAVAVEVHPFGLMAATVIAASFAFMLPVATPPNAIVYGSHVVGIQQMAWAGLWLNLLAVVVVTGFVCLLLPHVWSLDLQDATGLIP